MLNLSNNLAVPEHKLPENEELSEKCFARPRSWTQRDHADHDYHEWAEKQSAIEEAQLARGEIPLETSDKLRLVDYNLPVSQQFEELALRSIRELCPEYDLDRHPLRIMLADLPGQNAYYIDGSHPATIAINTGVLVGPDAVKSVDEFEAFLLHEVGHVLRRIAGVTENSRAEETQNEVEAAVTLQRHGRSPMVVLDFAHSAKKREKVDEILGLK